MDTQVAYIRHIHVVVHGVARPRLLMLQCARLLGALAHLNSCSKSISEKEKLVRVAASDTAVVEMNVCERHCL